VLHFTVEVTCIVAAATSYKGVRGEKLLYLIVRGLNLDAVLIELFLVHVFGDSFGKFMHFYNYY